jgi:hypothetical protein
MQLFALASIAALLMIAASLAMKFAHPGPAVRVALVLAPLVPLGLLAWSIHHAIAGLDELQVRIHLDALTSAFVGTAFLCVLVGQLQHARVGIPDLNWAFMWPAMVVLWAIAYVVATKRYE